MQAHAYIKPEKEEPMQVGHILLKLLSSPHSRYVTRGPHY